VYANLDGNGHPVLHAYSYNFLAMSLTPRSRKSGWFWRVKTDDMIWLASPEGPNKQEREEYVARKLSCQGGVITSSIMLMDSKGIV
jgi:hypothetical protein